MDIIYQHIERKMKFYGIDEFHLEPVIVKGEDTVKLNVTNEYLFLTSTSIPNGLQIIADNKAWSISDGANYVGQNLYNAMHFTGSVTIKANGSFTTEFIRVSPIFPITKHNEEFRNKYKDFQDKNIENLFLKNSKYSV